MAVATATLDRALPADSVTKGAPEWVHLLPSGLITGRDGRSYDLADPGGLILAFQPMGLIWQSTMNTSPKSRKRG